MEAPIVMWSPNECEACQTKLMSAIASPDLWSLVSSNESVYGDSKDGVIRLNQVLNWNGYRRRWPFGRRAGLECTLQGARGGCEISCSPRRIGLVRWYVRLSYALLLIMITIPGALALQDLSAGGNGFPEWTPVVGGLTIWAIQRRYDLNAFAEQEVQYLREFVMRVCDAREFA